MATITTFPNRDEYEKAKACMDAQAISYSVISPAPGFARVGVPALVVEPEARATLAARGFEAFVSSGWVDYRETNVAVPAQPPRSFSEDLFGTCAMVVLAPCVADPEKIRLIAHISGDLTDVFPYLNGEMARGMYNPHGPFFSFMDGYRMISLYPRRLTVAKADEIVDAWRTLEILRVLVNDTWMRRDSIEPSDEMRQKPPALEIYKRLPGINCGLCGEKTCMSFAVRLWLGETSPARCHPVFEGEYGRLEDAFLAICEGLGVKEVST